MAEFYPTVVETPEARERLGLRTRPHEALHAATQPRQFIEIDEQDWNARVRTEALGFLGVEAAKVSDETTDDESGKARRFGAWTLAFATATTMLDTESLTTPLPQRGFDDQLQRDEAIAASIPLLEAAYGHDVQPVAEKLGHIDLHEPLDLDTIQNLYMEDLVLAA